MEAGPRQTTECAFYSTSDLNGSLSIHRILIKIDVSRNSIILWIRENFGTNDHLESADLEGPSQRENKRDSLLNALAVRGLGGLAILLMVWM